MSTSLLDAQSTTPAGGIKLGDLVSVWRKRKWMILAIICTIPTLAAMVVTKQPKIYEASASLVIDSFVPQYLGAQFKDVVEIESNWWTAQETLQTELKVLKSYSQAVAVAKELCNHTVGPQKILALKKVLPGATCQDPIEYNKAGTILQNVLQVVPLRDSRVVILTVQHTDPEIAALLANTIAQVYTDRNLERRIAQSEGAADWLGTEYGDLNSQLNEAEHALIDFKKKYAVVAVSLEDQQNDLSSLHKNLCEELNNVQVKLIALRAQHEEYAQLKSDDPMLDITPGIADSPVIVRLKELYLEQYAKLVELRGKYLEKHPTVVTAEARVETIRADLKREATQQSRTLDAQYAALLKQEKDLRSALENATQQALQLEQRAIEYNRLKRNFDRLAKLSEQVGGRERETSLAGKLRTNNVRVLDAALVPTHHISPNVPAAVGSSLAIALVLAFGLAFLLELLDSTVKNPEDVEKTVGATFLGVIPTIDPDESKSDRAPPPPALAAIIERGSKDLYVLSYPKSSVAECCRAIRTNLLFMTPDNPAKTLLITSAARGEGKTTTVVNLSITLALSGLRVLIVDTDMRLPRVHKAFGLPSGPDGISKAIVGDAEVLDMVRETGVPNLYVLPCGAIPPNPAELLHAARFKAIVAKLAEEFDRVIFDSPPVGAVTDASILARHTQGTVLVAEGGRTTKDALRRARGFLTGSGVNVLGCILNDLDMSSPTSYGYYYYSRYGYYSGYTGDNEGGRPASQSAG